MLGPEAAFDSCYHPVRPIGATLLVTLPYLLTRDAVDASYLALALNITFFAVVVASVACALVGDRGVLTAMPRRAGVLAGLTFALFLPNMISLIPVRLADIPSLAPFAVALLVAVRTAGGSWQGRPLLRRYLVIGVLCAIAVLLNVRSFAFAFLLLGALLVLDANARGARVKCVAAFVLGMAPVSLQVANIATHTGQIGLYDREFMARHFPVRGGIEAQYATIPAPNAYMVRAADTVSYPDEVVLRLYRGLFGFEWSVYHGLPARGPTWAVTTTQRVGAWVMVLAYFAFSAAVILKGPPSLRLLNLTAALMNVVPALITHTELRYYALPRSILWLTIAILLLGAFPRPAAAWRSAPRTS